jgi:hypothetical protein
METTSTFSSLFVSNLLPLGFAMKDYMVTPTTVFIEVPLHTNQLGQITGTTTTKLLVRTI